MTLVAGGLENQDGIGLPGRERTRMAGASHSTRAVCNHSELRVFL
jgi:hypothetical protein